jgi:16S rRNA (uracil1498-N3)-methyltransferase
MQRYFASVQNGQALFSVEDRHHLLDVMRSAIGEKIEVVDGGDVYAATVTSLDPLVVQVGALLSKASELPVKLFLAFSLLKHGNDEEVLDKGTELGVASFYPFFSSRTIIHLDGEEEKKKRQDRFAKIVKAAAEQSKRTLIPTVEDFRDYSDILAVPATLKLLAYENESDDVASLPHALEGLKKGESCLIVIGPEGGFSPEEAALAKEKGFTFVSLGRRILRAETAAIYAASVFSYAMESERKPQ